MSKSISLALVGSSLLLAGCGKRRDQMTEEERREYDARYGSGSRGYYGTPGFFWGRSWSRGWGSSGSWSGGTSTSRGSSSSRGGFGGSSHAVGS